MLCFISPRVLPTRLKFTSQGYFRSLSAPSRFALACLRSPLPPISSQHDLKTRSKKLSTLTLERFQPGNLLHEIMRWMNTARNNEHFGTSRNMLFRLIEFPRLVVSSLKPSENSQSTLAAAQLPILSKRTRTHHQQAPALHQSSSESPAPHPTLLYQHPQNTNNY